MSQSVSSVIRRFYGFQFFFSLLIWVPVFYEFQKRVGLTSVEIFSIQSIYYLAFCLLEIPTGLIADLWGRRLCMILGATVVALSNLFPIFAPSYYGFILHFVGIALARSLISGASSAYIFDYMKANQAEQRYREIEGKARGYGLLGKIACWGAVGYLMEWHLTLPYWSTLAANFIGIGFALSLPVQPQESTRQKFSWSAIQAFSLNPRLFFIMAQGVAVFVLERICQVNLFQPILEKKGFELKTYGIVMGVMALFEAAGAFGVKAFPWARGEWSMPVMSLLLALCLGVIPGVGPAGVVAALAVFGLVTGISGPIQKQRMNEAILDSRYRATLLSVESILDRAVCAGVASVLGGYLTRNELFFFLGLASWTTAALVLLLQWGMGSQRAKP